MNSSSWFQQQSVALQTLLLVGVGLLIASPYWLMLIYRRRAVRIKKQHLQMAQRGQVRAVVHELSWHSHPLFKVLALATLLFIALSGFKATAGSFWFEVLNAYYLAVVLFFAYKGLSASAFENERRFAPALDRKTWMLRWLPLFVLLPMMGWLANSLPIILENN